MRMLATLLSVAAAAIPHGITVQGDSLSVGMKPYFGHSISYSAEVGRHTEEGISLLRNQRLGRRVVFALGTNDYLESGATYRAQLRRVARIIGPHRCLVVPTIYAFGKRDNMNDALLTFRRHYRRTRIVGWAREVANGHVTLADGLHPAFTTGWQARSRMVHEALRRC